MRGNHFLNLLPNIDDLADSLTKLKSTQYPSADDFIKFSKTIKRIKGLGLSTYSKFLYFLGIKFDGYNSLILDQKIIDVFSNEVFDEFSTLKEITYDNAAGRYIEYLELTNKIAHQLSTSGEKIEMFLFLFGNILKPIE